MTTSTTISASYGGVAKAATFTVKPATAPAPVLAGVTLGRTSIVGGTSTTAKVTLTTAAASGGAAIVLRTSNPSLVAVPASVIVAPGATSATFQVTTGVTKRNATAAVFAVYAGVTKSASITVKRK